jgi:hypothetical protein
MADSVVQPKRCDKCGGVLGAQQLPLTKTQAALLRFLGHYIAREACAPTYDEICAAFRWRSLSPISIDSWSSARSSKGTSRSGKTNLVRVFLEQTYGLIQHIVLDPRANTRRCARSSGRISSSARVATSSCRGSDAIKRLRARDRRERRVGHLRSVGARHRGAAH